MARSTRSGTLSSIAESAGTDATKGAANSTPAEEPGRPRRASAAKAKEAWASAAGGRVRGDGSGLSSAGAAGAAGASAASASPETSDATAVLAAIAGAASGGRGGRMSTGPAV